MNEAIKLEDPFRHKYNGRPNNQNGRNNNSNSSHLRLEIEQYKKEISRLKKEYKMANTNQLSMIQSLQQENGQLSVDTKSKYNKLKQYKQKLSAMENELKYKNDEITRLSLKLDQDLNHVTSEYVINEQRKQINELNEKLNSFEHKINQYENMKCDKNGGDYDNEDDMDQSKDESGWNYVSFVFNLIKSKYNG
mmetsp:Transcript_5233/g.4571  ORF Transcript_5233/g.4571 Transcript_5233/m.4571 type:complete len:193 (+) Transcript_5233:2-580(+)